jgi:thymidylate synthase (FAD)
VRIAAPKYQILQCPDGETILRLIERVGRDCYQSGDKIGKGTHRTFAKRILDNKHHAMIEFGDIVVRIISNRGFLAEVTRHRLCSFAVESTRYCCYAKGKFGGEIEVIGIGADALCPKGSSEEQTEALEEFFNSMEASEKAYLKLIKLGTPPQMAREVLPIGLRSTINMKANIREWRHIFSLRCAKDAHPRMREVMIPLLHELNGRIPILFEDLAEKFPRRRR